MRKDQIAGVLALPGLLEWVIFRRQRDTLEQAAKGSASLAGTELPVAGDGKEVPEIPRDVVERIGRETAELRGGSVTVAIPADRTLIRVVDLPSVPPDELAGMAELQADKFSPFPPESTVVSHEVVREVAGMCSVLIAVVNRDVVESVGAVMKMAGVEPARIDIAVLGWCRLIMDAGKMPAEGRHMAAIFDGALPVVVVFENGVPMLFRTLDKAHDILNEGTPGELAHEAGYTLMSVEMERGPADCSISVWAHGSVPAAVTQTIHEATGLKVSAQSLDAVGTVQKGVAGRTLAGGGIDLIPAAWRTSTQALLKKKQFVFSVGAILGVWALLMVVFFGGLYLQNWRVGYLARKTTEWKKLSEPVDYTRKRVLLIRKYADTDRSALECLREIAVNQPQGIDITSFTYRKNEELKIVGDALARPLIYDFKAALDRSKIFSRITIGVIRTDPQRSKQVFSMDLEFPKAAR